MTNGVIPMRAGDCHVVGRQDADYWSQVIAKDWRSTVDGIIKTGRDLLAAQEALPHGEWQRMTGRDGNGGMLPFGWRAAHALKSVAENPVISNVQHVAHLPASWGTLYELTRLNDLPERIEAGEITPDLDRATVTKWLKRQRSQSKQSAHDIDIQPGHDTVQAPDGVNPGWVLKLRADLLFYHILDCDELYILPFRWMQHAVINGFTDIGVKPLVQTCKLVPQRKAAQKNLTTGLLVGIELLDSLSKKTRCGRPITKVNPLGLFADEEKEVALTGNRVP